MPLTSYSGPEALDWLKSNMSKSGFASNRFESTEAAIEFVSKLYNAGAKHVFIPDDSIRVDKAESTKWGGPYSDSLVILLPDNNRTQIFELFDAEAEIEGFDDMKGETSVIDGKYLYLWWD